MEGQANRSADNNACQASLMTSIQSLQFGMERKNWLPIVFNYHMYVMAHICPHKDDKHTFEHTHVPQIDYMNTYIHTHIYT